MLKSTLRVRFQGLGADVDEKAKRGQERRKERKLRRQRRKMAQEQIFQRGRAFLQWLAQRYVHDDDDDGEEGIFRNVRGNVTAAAGDSVAILELSEGKVLIASAKEKEYFHGDDDEHVVHTLLANNCDWWKNDEVFVLQLAAWAAAATAAGHYLTYSYSSSSGEDGDRVEVDATRVTLVRNLGYYSDTFLSSKEELLAKVCRLVASGDIDATTTALAKDLLGDNFQTVSPQDADAIEAVQNAIKKAISERAPTKSHHVQLEASATWLVDSNVTPEQRSLVFSAVFGPGTKDHVSRASTSVGADAAT